MKIIQIMGSDQRVCQAARVSLMRDDAEYTPERDIKLLHYLRKHRHTSPFEHVRLLLAFPRDKHSLGFLRDKLRTECVTANGPVTLVTCDLHNMLMWLEKYKMVEQQRTVAMRLPASCYPEEATWRSESRLDLRPAQLDHGAGTIAYVDHMSNGHDDSDKHCVITFRIKVPKFIAVQHMRHRTWSFNEISRRYTSDALECWKPRQLRKQAKSNLQASDGVLDATAEIDALLDIEDSMMCSLENYNRLIDAGVTREQARAVLPMGIMTTYYATAPLKWVKHFMRLRLHEGAQPEIQALAEEIRIICEHKFPTQMKGWKP